MTETPRATLSRLTPTVFLVAVVATGAILVWQLLQMLLLVFAAALVAVLLRGGVDLVRTQTPLGLRAATIVTFLVAAALLLGFLALLGRQIYVEVTDLVTPAPELIRTAEEQLGAGGIEDWLRERVASAVQEASIVGEVASFGTLVLGGVANLFLVLVAGAFMAYAPGLYRDGLVSLFPPRRHAQVVETLDAAGDGLRLWLVGQLIAMVLVGVLSTVGLTVLGVPSGSASASSRPSRTSCPSSDLSSGRCPPSRWLSASSRRSRCGWPRSTSPSSRRKAC